MFWKNAIYITGEGERLDYTGYYEVSQNGDIRSLGRYVDNNGGTEWREGKTLHTYSNTKRNNYEEIIFCIGNHKKAIKVHRLVASTFPEICGEWFEGAEPDHINTITTDNRAENIRWVSRSGNMQNPITKDRLSKVALEHSEERSERMKGDLNPARRRMTEEWRQHMSESQKGRVHSEEAKEKMREAAKGKYLGEKSIKAKAVGYEKDGQTIRFGGMREAERETGFSRSSIARSIRDKKPTKGIIWKYL